MSNRKGKNNKRIVGLAATDTETLKRVVLVEAAATALNRKKSKKERVTTPLSTSGSCRFRNKTQSSKSECSPVCSIPLTESTYTNSTTKIATLVSHA
jgi:hypothetical protein